MLTIAFDTETKLFEDGCVCPPVVCGSFCMFNDETDLLGAPFVLARADGQIAAGLHEMFDAAIDGRARLVGHNIAYDLAVSAEFDPSLMPKIWRALELGRIHDTGIRERLLLLSTTGNLDYLEVRPGVNIKLTFSLAELEKLYIGRDRSGDKDDEDAWRTNYHMLIDVPLARWPAEAIKYAADDAEGTLLVFLRQEQKAREGGGSLTTETFQVGVAFALQLMSVYGVAIDEQMRDLVAARLREERAPERMKTLLSLGVLTPAKPPRAYKNGKGWTKGKKESCSTKKLQALIEEVCLAHGLEVPRNEPTEKALEKDPNAIGNVSYSKDTLEDIAHLHPALEEYQYRAYLDKLVTTELPRMSGPVVYPQFNVLVSTGRTSSFASKKYASANIQNVSSVKKLQSAEDGEESGEEINIRHCYVARPGKVLVSNDYLSLEYCSLAQQCFELFGHSTMRDLINSGADAHAYLGGQIAASQHVDFRGYLSTIGALGDRMATYEAFLKCKTGSESQQKFFKKFRKLAKPVGFGFPGGLGAAKFVQFAKGHPYHVRVTEAEARQLKDLFLDAYPEMVEYFAWINTQKDPNLDGKYIYTSPLGMIRAGASYTAAANGRLLQTPAAEGAKLAVWECVRACYDPGYNSILYGQRIVAFIHDELLFEFDDDELLTARAQEASRIMVRCMERILPDVLIRAEPAAMRRWDKEAEPVYDAAGRLVPWDDQPAALAA